MLIRPQSKIKFWLRLILVKAIDLKKILKARPFGIIKMDVEGAEIELTPIL